MFARGLIVIAKVGKHSIGAFNIEEQTSNTHNQKDGSQVIILDERSQTQTCTASMSSFLCLVWFWDLFCLFETGFLYSFGAYPGTHYVDQAGLDSQRSACLCLPSAGIKGMLHHCPAS